jgi:enoyl-CoA hydratase
MELEFVRLERHGEVAVLAIDRRPAANAIDEAVLRDLEDAFIATEEDGGVRAVVVTGAGDGPFSAGGDVRAMRDMTVAEGRRFVELGHRVMNRIAGSDVVSVAAVGGAALGGGAELALACDIRVAADTAVLGYPEVRLGLYPAWGGTQRAARALGPSRTMLLMLTGDRVPAAEALRLGLVDRVVQAPDVMTEALAIATRIARNSPSAVRQAKMAITHGAEQSLTPALRLEIEGWMVNFAHPDRVEGLTAFLERREPRWAG